MLGSVITRRAAERATKAFLEQRSSPLVILRERPGGQWVGFMMIGSPCNSSADSSLSADGCVI
ncbi:MAG: hypothetical protein AUI36_24050 [Cyanobacteria bacterium 13_1_40CM_2_61_4]|nr:MAG: hypothetical protein AUI36_24050 [Cyanobacteria bacterium 13_1_40CM_2_61_4]